MRVAIIGAGMSGLSAARVLVRAGAEVTVFDKGRSPGGRASTRLQSGFEFDHGAPFFSATHGRFRAFVEEAAQAGCALAWRVQTAEVDRGEIMAGPRAETLFVGIPGMNALPHYLARGIAVRCSTSVTSATRTAGRWDLSANGVGEPGRYDVLLISTPPAQALPLLAEAPALQTQAGRVSMDPCWTVLAALDSAVDVPWDVAVVPGGGLHKVSRNRGKPARPEAETWVMHAKAGWTSQHLDLHPEEVVKELLADFEAATGARLPGILFTAAHRWRYARPASPLRCAFLWDSERRIGVCGDWCHGTDIESAYLSGWELANAVSQILS